MSNTGDVNELNNSVQAMTLKDNSSSSSSSTTNEPPVEADMPDREADKVADDLREAVAAATGTKPIVDTSNIAEKGSDGQAVGVNVVAADGTELPSTLKHVMSKYEWKDMGFPQDRAESLLKALDKKGWTKPSAIQARSLPFFLNADKGATINGMLGQAFNGAGKTGAFTLAALSRIKRDVRGPQVIVLAPTNPLAYQLYEQISSLAPGVTNMTPVPFPVKDADGNISIGQLTTPRVVQVAAGQDTAIDAEIIVGTEVVIYKAMRAKHIARTNIHTMIVDEADEMLQKNRGNTLVDIKKGLNKDAVTLLFSASLNSLDPKTGDWQVRERADRILDLPAQKDNVIKIVQPPNLKSINVVHAVVPVEFQRSFRDMSPAQRQVLMEKKCEYIAELIGCMEANTKFLIFVNSNVDAIAVSNILRGRNINVAAIAKPKENSGDKFDPNAYKAWQEKVVQIITAFRSGKIDVLVGTGQLARGVDIPNLEVVINFNIPLNYASAQRGPDIARFQHQCGRVGRIGQTVKGLGTCIHFITNAEESAAFDGICNALNMEPIILSGSDSIKKDAIRHAGDLAKALQDKEMASKDPNAAANAVAADDNFTSGAMTTGFGTGKEIPRGPRGGYRSGNTGTGTW